MAAPSKPTSADLAKNPGLAGVIATQRELLAKRVADTPAMWISIPAWARAWVNGRRLLGLDRRKQTDT